MPHAVHEHVRVLRPQRAVAPFVDLGVHPLELVGERLRGHAVAPRQLAGVIHTPGGHAGQVHVDQGLLDALLPAPVAFDDRGLEDRALELGHPEFELACFRGGSALVMAGAERLAVIDALVSGSSGDLVRFRVGHRVEDPGYFLGDEPVEFSFEQVLVDLYDGVVGHGPRSVFALAVLLVWRLKIVYGTQAMPASTSRRRAKPKVRRNPDVIEGSMSCIV